jgi:hypothetical protein
MEQDSSNDGETPSLFSRFLRRGAIRAEPETSEDPDAAATEAGRRHQLQRLAGQHTAAADHRGKGNSKVTISLVFLSDFLSNHLV